MAEISPFRAWRYNHFLKDKVSELSAPLNESLLTQKAAFFYRYPFHHFHISSPIDVPPFENARRRVENWQLDKVILQDALPAIYVYAQRFQLPSQTNWQSRMGFICQIKPNQQEILPHERTIARAVEYRVQLLEYTQMQTLPTHGLYEDSQAQLESYLEEALTCPIYTVKDQQGVEHRLAVIHDYKIIQRFVEVLASKKIFIADGHHRYESSEQFFRQNQAHRHLMWLSNVSKGDAGILPTHRLVHSLKHFEPQKFLQKLREYFEIKPFSQSPQDFVQSPPAKQASFLLLLAAKHYLLELRPETLQAFQADLPDIIKELEVSILDYFILEKCLGLKGQMQYDYVDFSQQEDYCTQALAEERVNFALLTRAIRFPTIRDVCLSGNVMPAKATYFYPKMLGGLLFSDA